MIKIILLTLTMSLNFTQGKVIDRIDNEIIAIDYKTQNEWSFYIGNEDTLSINDEIIMIINNRKTSIIFNDEILEYIFLE